MKNFKKIIASALVVAMLTSCTQNAQKGTKLETIAQNGKIEVYTDPNFPPFEYMRGTDPAGVDIELAKAIADDLGVELEIKNADFDSIIAGLATGKGDVAISGMTITEERKEQVDFSDPYIKSVQYLLVLNESEIKTMEDLAGKKVGVALGYTGQFVLEDELAEGVLVDCGVETVVVNSANEGALEVSNNKIDAMIIDEYVAKKIDSDNNSLTAIKLVYESGDEISEEYGVVIPKGNKELKEQINKTIDRLTSNGTIEQWVIDHS